MPRLGKKMCENSRVDVQRAHGSSPEGSTAGWGFSPPARWSVPQRGMGRAAPAEIEFGANFGLKIRYLVTTVLMIFVRID